MTSAPKPFTISLFRWGSEVPWASRLDSDPFLASQSALHRSLISATHLYVTGQKPPTVWELDLSYCFAPGSPDELEQFLPGLFSIIYKISNHRAHSRFLLKLTFQLLLSVQTKPHPSHSTLIVWLSWICINMILETFKRTHPEDIIWESGTFSLKDQQQRFLPSLQLIPTRHHVIFYYLLVRLI